MGRWSFCGPLILTSCRVPVEKSEPSFGARQINAVWPHALAVLGLDHGHPRVFPSNSGNRLVWPGCWCVTTTNAIAFPGGTCEKNSSRASRPPAEAPTPTMGNKPVAVRGLPTAAGRTFRLRDAPPRFALPPRPGLPMGLGFRMTSASQAHTARLVKLYWRGFWGSMLAGSGLLSEGPLVVGCSAHWTGKKLNVGPGGSRRVQAGPGGPTRTTPARKPRLPWRFDVAASEPRRRFHN